MNPQKHIMTVLAQIASWIPVKIVENLASKAMPHLLISTVGAIEPTGKRYPQFLCAVPRSVAKRHGAEKPAGIINRCEITRTKKLKKLIVENIVVFFR